MFYTKREKEENWDIIPKGHFWNGEFYIKVR